MEEQICFVSEYVKTALHILRIAMPNSPFFKAELIQVNNVAVGLFVSYKGVEKDECLLDKNANLTKLKEKLVYLSPDFSRFEEMISQFLTHPDKVIGGWKKHILFFVKGGVNPGQWGPQNAIDDILTLLSSVLLSKQPDIPKIRTCYFCDKIATSMEHVPPKCLFPEKKDVAGKDYRKNLITVPSCENHNFGKNKDDEYLMYVLAISMSSNELALSHFNTKILRAISRNPGLFEKFSKPNFPVRVLENGKLELTAALEVDMKRLSTVLAHIAAGLYYNHFEEKFTGSVSVFPNKFVDPRENVSEEFRKTVFGFDKAMNIAFSNVEGYGENKDVFYYKIIEDKEKRNLLLLLTFYSSTQFTLTLTKKFEGSTETKRVLIKVD